MLKVQKVVTNYSDLARFPGIFARCLPSLWQSTKGRMTKIREAELQKYGLIFSAFLSIEILKLKVSSGHEVQKQEKKFPFS
jgi:hypothetical protein